MTAPAADTLTSNSPASLGSIGSMQRSEMPALNPASASKRIAFRGDPLGRKALDPPSGAGTRVEQPIVQPVGAALPEFDLPRDDAITAPMRGAGRVVAETPAHLLHFLFQDFPRRNRLALRRGPGGHARAQGARGEIGIRFGSGELLDRAFDAHLPLQLGPLEYQAGDRARLELARLAAAVAGIEGEAA